MVVLVLAVVIAPRVRSALLIFPSIQGCQSTLIRWEYFPEFQLLLISAMRTTPPGVFVWDSGGFHQWSIQVPLGFGTPRDSWCSAVSAQWPPVASLRLSNVSLWASPRGCCSSTARTAWTWAGNDHLHDCPMVYPHNCCGFPSGYSWWVKGYQYLCTNRITIAFTVMTTFYEEIMAMNGNDNCTLQSLCVYINIVYNDRISYKGSLSI